MDVRFKKGPFVETHLARKITKLNETGSKKPIKTLSCAVRDHPEICRHTFNVYGKGFQPGICDGKHGGPPARRIFADPHVQENTALIRPKRKRNSPMQVHAILKNINMSAQKMRELVRRSRAWPACRRRRCSPWCRAKSARFVAKTLKSGHCQRRGPGPLPEDQPVQDGEPARPFSRGRHGLDRKTFHPQGAGFGGTDSQAPFATSK